MGRTPRLTPHRYPPPQGGRKWERTFHVPSQSLSWRLCPARGRGKAAMGAKVPLILAFMLIKEEGIYRPLYSGHEG